MKLNQEQENAVYSNARFLFLLAGAGSGKTRVIIERIKHLLNTVSPDKILAITFTRKAADEMKKRLGNDLVEIATFHQFCYGKIGGGQVIDEDHHIPFSQEDKLKITKYKNSLYRARKPNIYEAYQSYLAENHLKDFDDLLLDFHEMQRKKEWTAIYQHIFIDEFQDTNHLQYEILKRLVTKETHVFAVGDPDQSIYQFRGSDQSIINRFISEFRAEMYTLSMNYRSTPQIIDIANRLITFNTRRMKKTLIATHLAGDAVSVYAFPSITEEANFVLEIILKLKQQNMKNVAILYRNHYHANEVYALLTLEHIIFSEYENTVQLMTFHQAKGLEFDIVIIIGLTKILLKENRKSLMEEERRLMFVAITRAKKKLYLLYSQTDAFGHMQKPSIFLRESGVKTGLKSLLL